MFVSFRSSDARRNRQGYPLRLSVEVNHRIGKTSQIYFRLGTLVEDMDALLADSGAIHLPTESAAPVSLLGEVLDVMLLPT